MTVQDTPPVPALPDRARPFRWVYFSVRLLMVGALLAIAALLPGSHNGAVLRYRESAIARDAEQPRAASLLSDRHEALLVISRHSRSAFADDPRAQRLVEEITAPFVQPNIVYDRAETEWRRVQAQGVVPATLGYVKKDELILDANQRISHEALLKLQSLHNLEAARGQRSDLVYPPLARILLMLLFIAVFAIYLRMELPSVYRDNAMLAMFTLLTALVLGLAELLVGVLNFSEFMVPLALAPLVVGSLLEKRPALVFTLVPTVAATRGSALKAPFAAVPGVGGVTAGSP